MTTAKLPKINKINDDVTGDLLGGQGWGGGDLGRWRLVLDEFRLHLLLFLQSLKLLQHLYLIDDLED